MIAGIGLVLAIIGGAIYIISKKKTRPPTRPLEPIHLDNKPEDQDFRKPDAPRDHGPTGPDGT